MPATWRSVAVIAQLAAPVRQSMLRPARMPIDSSICSADSPDWRVGVVEHSQTTLSWSDSMPPYPHSPIDPVVSLDVPGTRRRSRRGGSRPVAGCFLPEAPQRPETPGQGRTRSAVQERWCVPALCRIPEPPFAPERVSPNSEGTCIGPGVVRRVAQGPYDPATSHSRSSAPSLARGLIQRAVSRPVAHAGPTRSQTCAEMRCAYP